MMLSTFVQKSTHAVRSGIRRWHARSPFSSFSGSPPRTMRIHHSRGNDLQISKAFVRFTSSKVDSTTSGSNTRSRDGMKFVYVHPLSQIVLECLQSDYSEWLLKHGLDDKLSFHRDGTFEIKFPKSPDNTPEKHQVESDSRIWTSFDDHEKKHWLMVKRGKLVGRYMLQDNLMPAWHSNRRGSLPARIQHAVSEMVVAIEDLDRKNKGKF